MNTQLPVGTVRIGLGLWLLVTMPLAAFQTGGQPAIGPPVNLTCSPESPVIRKNETVTLRAWVRSETGEKVAFSWAADAGTITGNEHEVQWNLRGVQPRPRAYTATVRVSFSSDTSASCSIQVVVIDKERGTRETGRTFLVKGANEATGYGLYSYVLLGSRANAANRERYLKAIQAYLDAIGNITELQDYFPKNRLNVAYLPIEVKPNSAYTAEWLVDKYDYGRARALLASLRGDLREGPYLISVLKPLTSGNSTDQFLLQDLSGVPLKNNDIIVWWVREFLNQAAQERYWEPRTAELLALKIRTTIGVLAEGLPDVQRALTDWISWLH